MCESAPLHKSPVIEVSPNFTYYYAPCQVNFRRRMEIAKKGSAPWNAHLPPALIRRKDGLDGRGVAENRQFHSSLSVQSIPLSDDASVRMRIPGSRASFDCFPQHRIRPGKQRCRIPPYATSFYPLLKRTVIRHFPQHPWPLSPPLPSPVRQRAPAHNVQTHTQNRLFRLSWSADPCCIRTFPSWEHPPR